MLTHPVGMHFCRMNIFDILLKLDTAVLINLIQIDLYLHAKICSQQSLLILHHTSTSSLTYDLKSNHRTRFYT